MLSVQILEYWKLLAGFDFLVGNCSILSGVTIIPVATAGRGAQRCKGRKVLGEENGKKKEKN